MRKYKKYEDWLENGIIFLSQYYKCTIKLPYHPEDVNCFVDGIIVDFTEINFHVFISNYVLHELFKDSLTLHYVYQYKNLREIIDTRLDDAVRKKQLLINYN